LWICSYWDGGLIIVKLVYKEVRTDSEDCDLRF